MTTKWEVPNDLWKGETVAVLASGPSLTAELADSVRQYRRIVVNHAHLLAPDADMLVALDSQPEFFEQAAGFAGFKLCGGELDMEDVKYIGQRYERVELAPANIVELRNSGLTAIRLAAEAGASKILLLGYEPEVSGHFAGYPEEDRDWDASDPYSQGVAAGLAAIIRELTAQGIEVERLGGEFDS